MQRRLVAIDCDKLKHIGTFSNKVVPNKAVQLVQLLRSSKREMRLGTVILFVTSRCNAFCQTCFYHEELNNPGDMTFDQIAKVSRTMPPITDLWLSGGEPTLRRDLSDIIDP